MTTQKAGELLAENMKTLYLWSMHKTSDPIAAEDLCSDVMLAVMQAAPRLRYEEAFFGFVWKVAANTYKRYLRKKSKTRESALSEPLSEILPETDADPLVALIDSEEAGRELSVLRRELAFLSRAYRLCTVAYYYDGLSVKEIAERYHMTADSVKFYLFQSRKILKEGIAMERQFGEKSFRPHPFYFGAITSGTDDNLLRELLSRKIPGQILLSAYGEPVTLSQLSVELGVASVYLEDEVETLEKHHLLKRCGKQKVQTHMLILTKQEFDDCFDAMDREFSASLAEGIGKIRNALPALRQVGFVGADLPEHLLVWDFMTLLIIRAFGVVAPGHYEAVNDSLGAVCFASDFEPDEKRYNYVSFSGEYNMRGFRGSKICFAGQRDHGDPLLWQAEGYTGRYFPVLTETEKAEALAILAEAEQHMIALVRAIAARQVEIVRSQVPDAIEPLVDSFCPHLTLWQTVGWYAAAAVATGALPAPSCEEFAGIVGYRA